MGSNSIPDTKATSTRLYPNSAYTVEEMVLRCVPNWRNYPRVLRVVLASLYRYGSFDECIEDLALIEGFTDALTKYASPQYRDEVRKLANRWYEKGELPKGSDRSKRKNVKGLTFTLLNQQLFYETTMAANAKMYLAAGSPAGSDVKMAIEGGFGNALEMERVRHNAVRKAQADFKAAGIKSEVMSEDEDDGGMFDGHMMEYAEPIPMSEELDDEE